VEQFYSLSSAAKKLDISIKTIRRLIQEHSIDMFRVGSRLRIKESDLKRLAVKSFNFEDVLDEIF
jgi:excisionase family DNA binding protein